MKYGSNFISAKLELLEAIFLPHTFFCQHCNDLPAQLHCVWTKSGSWSGQRILKTHTCPPYFYQAIFLAGPTFLTLSVSTDTGKYPSLGIGGAAGCASTKWYHKVVWKRVDQSRSWLQIECFSRTILLVTQTNRFSKRYIFKFVQGGSQTYTALQHFLLVSSTTI